MDFILEDAKFRRIDQGQVQSSGAQQLWEMIAPAGHTFGRVEIWEAPNQWGVRVADQAPDLDDSQLLTLVKRMLIWDVGCRADTVEVVFARTSERHTLVRVDSEYV